MNNYTPADDSEIEDEFSAVAEPTNLEIGNKILTQSIEQLRMSRNNKRQRFEAIKESEDLYLGKMEKSLRNPYNECFPFMAGFIDHYRSKIDDDSELQFIHGAEADLKKAMKIQGMYDRVSRSPAPSDSWNIKHRHAKYNALFSGRAIYKYFAESDPKYRSHLSVVSHWDFHNEPRGGGLLENHLFCGEDNIFKTEQDLKGDRYERAQVERLVKQYQDNGWKDNAAYELDRNNRAVALGQDPEGNNYVGQGVIKLVEWYTTFEGKRYYILFNEESRVWVRFCPLTDMFPDDLWPYLSWATNEDPDVFWNKAPADDARPIARIVNTMLNQELYNRQKRNYGQRAYDPDMFPNVAALADWRPDGLVPFDSKGGNRRVEEGLYEFKVGDLNGTLDLVTYLDSFTGRQTGNTPGSQGASEKDKRATVFAGELEQVDRLVGVKNKSYRDMLSELGLRFKQGLEHNLTEEESVKIMGGKGVEWVKLSPEELELEGELTIIPIGGTSELQLKREKDRDKGEALAAITTVNPQWKDRQILLLKGFTPEEAKEAFSSETFAEKELLSEAAMAEKQIVEGETPALNRGASVAFMQHIIDFATDTNDLPLETYKRLMEYAEEHTEIVIENQNRSVKEMLAARTRQSLSTALPPSPALPAQPAPIMNRYGGSTGGVPAEII